MSFVSPAQVTELEAEFEKLPPQKPQQSRFLRSQQDLKAKMESQAAAASAGGDQAQGGVGLYFGQKHIQWPLYFVTFQL